jgi:chromosome partitioning protein
MKIAFSNQKGGVGKTTVCRELGICLSSGKKVLFVDTDPQGNLSKSLCDEGKGLYEAFQDEEIDFQKISESLFLLRGDIRLSLLEKNLLGEIDAYERLKEVFKRPEFTDFDYILIDTPPSLGVLTINALSASDGLIIPVSCRMYSLQGTNDLMATVSKVKKSLNPDLKLLGVIINSFDRVPVIMREIRTEIENSFGEAVFNEVLSKSIKIEEAIAQKKGVTQIRLKKEERIAEEISRLTEELKKRSRI